MIKDPHVECFAKRMLNKGIFTKHDYQTFVERAEMLEEEEERDLNPVRVIPPNFSDETSNAWKVRYKGP